MCGFIHMSLRQVAHCSQQNVGVENHEQVWSLGMTPQCGGCPYVHLSKDAIRYLCRLAAHESICMETVRCGPQLAREFRARWSERWVGH